MRTLATIALFACACSSSPEPPAVAPDVTEDSVTDDVAQPPKLLDTAPPASKSLVNLCDEPMPTDPDVRNSRIRLLGSRLRRAT